jgi:hypothetical protein
MIETGTMRDQISRRQSSPLNTSGTIRTGGCVAIGVGLRSDANLSTTASASCAWVLAAPLRMAITWWFGRSTIGGCGFWCRPEGLAAALLAIEQDRKGGLLIDGLLGSFRRYREKSCARSREGLVGRGELGQGLDDGQSGLRTKDEDNGVFPAIASSRRLMVVPSSCGNTQSGAISPIAGGRRVERLRG